MEYNGGMMHIAMLSIHSSPLARLGGKEAGGMNVYVRETARELARRGVLVDVFTRRQHPDTPEVADIAPGARVVQVAAGPVAPYDKTRILDHLPELCASIETYARNHGRRYQLIHSHYFVSGAAALALRQRWGVPVVQMFHTLGALKNRVARSREETEADQRVAVERQLLREADAIVAATAIDRQHMLDHYDADAGRIHIIPPGVDVDFFQPQPRAEARARLGLPADQRVLLWVGRMEALKGVDALLRAVALLRDDAPDLFGQVRVVLVGGEPEDAPDAWNYEQRRLATLRAALGVGEVVRFVGAQPHALLPAFYAAADVFAMPSHYESFGMVALEALACGVPVVASGVGGLSVLIEDGQSGLLVPPDSPAPLAAALRRVLSDGALAAALADGARQRALRYAWAAVVAALWGVYGEVRGAGY
jgi:D-inositol-3-phosphate glycosyltransferase